MTNRISKSMSKILRNNLKDCFFIGAQYDIEKMTEDDIASVVSALKNVIDINYIVKNYSIHNFNTDGLSDDDFVDLYNTVGTTIPVATWGLLLKSTDRYVPLFFDCVDQLNKQKIRDILRENTKCFECGTVEDFEKIINVVTAKELISTFRMSSWKRKPVKYYWRTTYKYEKNHKTVCINKELSEWLIQEAFMGSVSGKSTSSLPLNSNMVFLKENTIGDK